ncbi:type II secretion system protein [Noviherbaspirillum aridicola]|uniref:MSHA pilin protein MshA n=1 Tax=Noviherbaspirillum aridicola TaxID=2849687 RepID=A0ABQ4Q5V3_9BURK|nr:type II secretion system protein [Noviherbaspirillum aridicola]GIZ52427.1 hypothetical protein NCCP691_24410 [Noviherbaspirillum aridicola]
MKNTKHGQSGFTLIELVVVIVILGILAATALPKFVDMSGEARTAAVKGVAGALGSASSVNYAGNIAKGGASNGPITGASATSVVGIVDTSRGCNDAVATELLQAGVTFDSTSPFEKGSYKLSGVGSIGNRGASIDCTVISNDDNEYSATFTLIGAK